MVVERCEFLTRVAWNASLVLLTVVEFELPLDAESSCTINARKEPYDR
jgi:hypothetical protein